MKKNTIWILISSVTITLLGLIVLQAFWIRNARNVKEKQFEFQVNSGLSAVVTNLQKEETVSHISSAIRSNNADSTVTFSEKASPNLKSVKPLNFSKEIYLFTQSSQSKLKANISVIPGEHVNTERGSITWNTRSYNPQKKIGNSNEIHSKVTSSVQNKTELVENIVNKLINSHLKIEDRLNKSLIERTIKAELLLKGISLPFQFSVKDDAGNVIFKSDSFSEAHTANNFLVRLFPDDIFNQVSYLTVYFPEQDSYTFKSIGFIVISSIFLTTIIIVIIASAVYIILKQKRLSEVKTDFINNMTHELKTPISTISLASQMLGDKNVAAENKNIETISKLILDESKRLGLLVEKVLQMAVFDRAHLKLRLKQFNVNELAENILNNFAIQIKTRNGKIFKELQAEDPIIVADEMHITNLIVNLLDNAVKYCDKEPVIIVATSNKNGGVVIEVKDNGIGISKENQKRIFEQFYRVPTGNIHNAKGFGLGLSYVRKIADAHNASITIESKPGHGSIFSVLLPLKQNENLNS